VRFLLDSARKDLHRRLQDPLALVLWLGIPLAIGGLIGLASSGGGGKPTAHVLFVDQDDTFLSNLVSGARGQGELSERLQIEDVGLEEGMERIEAGDATALVVLPEGFTEALLEDEPATITLVKNPALTIMPAIVEEALEMLVEAAFYLQRVMGEPLRELADGPPDGAEFFADEVIASFSGEINRRMRKLEDLLFPVVLKLEDEAQEEGDPDGFNFGTVFVPGVLFMALLFIAQGMIEDLWTEKEQGTLRRIVSTPQSLLAFLGGKLAAGAVLMAAATLIGLAVDVLVYDVALGAVPFALVWCTFAGTALLALFLLIQFLASSRRAASILTSSVLFPLMMIGGSFFPFEAMPDWMVAVGRWTPNGMGVIVLKDVLRQELELSSLLVPVVALGGLTVLALFLSERVLMRRFVRS
jgi:ABC-type multidrug transport system permease subunit